MSTVKIALVGPKGVGKTILTNALAGDYMNYGADNATAGCRIREFRTQLRREDSSAAVELWDVSGDLKYENCWPSVGQNLNGLVIMYNPKNEMQSKEVGLWMEAFVKNSKLKTGQAVIFALNLPKSTKPNPVQMGSVKIPIVGVTMPMSTADGKEFPQPKARSDIKYSSQSPNLNFDTFVEQCYQLQPDNQALDDEDDAFLDGGQQ